MNKTKISLISAWALAGLLIATFTGCIRPQTNVQKDKQVVSTDGSTSMEKVIGYLSEVYMTDHPNTTITYNPTGSGAGI